MKRLALIIAGVVVAGGVAATPAVAGLAGNQSFSHEIPIPVPSAAKVVQFADDHGGTTAQAEPTDDHGRTTAQAEPTDDRGGATSHAEPGDDHGGTTPQAEPTDDHGGATSHPEPGDDHGGHDSGKR